MLALPLGYAAGRFVRRSRSALTLVMLLPLLLYAVAAASEGPAVSVLLAELIGVMLLFSPVIVVWLILAIVGFTFGRRKVADLP